MRFSRSHNSIRFPSRALGAELGVVAVPLHQLDAKFGILTVMAPVETPGVRVSRASWRPQRSTRSSEQSKSFEGSSADEKRKDKDKDTPRRKLAKKNTTGTVEHAKRMSELDASASPPQSQTSSQARPKDKAKTDEAKKEDAPKTETAKTQ